MSKLGQPLPGSSVLHSLLLNCISRQSTLMGWTEGCCDLDTIFLLLLRASGRTGKWSILLIKPPFLWVKSGPPPIHSMGLRERRSVALPTSSQEVTMASVFPQPSLWALYTLTSQRTNSAKWDALLIFYLKQPIPLTQLETYFFTGVRETKHLLLQTRHSVQF